jgi:hypothetical protein
MNTHQHISIEIQKRKKELQRRNVLHQKFFCSLHLPIHPPDLELINDFLIGQFDPEEIQKP